MIVPFSLPNVEKTRGRVLKGRGAHPFYFDAWIGSDARLAPSTRICTREKMSIFFPHAEMFSSRAPASGYKRGLTRCNLGATRVRFGCCHAAPGPARALA